MLSLYPFYFDFHSARIIFIFDVSSGFYLIAKLMLWDTMFDKSRHRLSILNQGEYLANLYPKENLDNFNLSHLKGATYF
jgi:hypothetical protein